MKRKELYIHIALSVFALMVVVLIIPKGSLFGSHTDWLSQHISIPNYFRELFYSTGELFPDFASHLGAGQNIYNFSYYGLFSPMVLVSYALPFVDMVHIVIVFMITSMIATVNMCYIWLRNNKFNRNVAITVSLMLLLSSSLMFHSHRHIMFVNYIPWLMLTLIGVDRFLKNGKGTLLMIGTFMMVLSSYFFSVSAIIACFAYFIYRLYLQSERLFVKENGILCLKCIAYIFIGIAMSGILLLPTAMALLGGARGGNTAELMKLFKPDFRMASFFYGVYGSGLTAIAWICICLQFVQKKKRTLAIFLALLFVFPIFKFLLNGTLYLRAKVFIAFLPVVMFVVADTLHSLKNKTLKFNWLCLIPILIPYFYIRQSTGFILDVIVSLGLLLVYNYNKNKHSVLLLLVIPLIVCVVGSKQEKYVKEDYYKKVYDKEVENVLDDYLSKDKARFADLTHPLSTTNLITSSSMYKSSYYSSVQNTDYNDFYYSMMRNPIQIKNRVACLSGSNPFFHGMMNHKYLLTNQNIPYGYETIEKTKRGNLVMNKDVMPLAYATSDLYSEEAFDRLSYPQNLDTIYNASVVDGVSNKEYESKMQEVELDYEVIQNSNDIEVVRTGNNISLNVKKAAKIKLKPNQEMENKILLVSFKLENIKHAKTKDTTIVINKVKNKLSSKNASYPNDNNPFYYMFASDDDLKLMDVSLSKGSYDLNDIKVYALDYDVIKDRPKNVDALVLDDKKQGDVLSGSIQVKEDGYFVTSIPYQKGMKVYLDGKKIEYERVNKAFVGFPIKEGEHKVVIDYEAPAKKAGVILSEVGIALFAICIVRNRRGKKL